MDSKPTITGQIYDIYPVQQVSDSFRKREVIIVTMGEYPQHVKIEFTQDRCDALNEYQRGQPVTINYDLRGRLYQKKDGTGEGCFTSVQGWRIQPAGQPQQLPPGYAAPMPAPAPQGPPPGFPAHAQPGAYQQFAPQTPPQAMPPQAPQADRSW